MKESTLAGLIAYRDQRRPPGGFLRAVLENDLLGAFLQGDNDNLDDLREIVRFAYNQLPIPCWGSKERVQAWLNGKPKPEEGT